MRRVLLLAAALLAAAPAWAQLDYARGLRNYESILTGAKKFEQLTETEKQEVMHIRAVQLQYRKKDSPECQSARSEAQSNASNLSQYIGRLQRCVAAEDFKDDCGSEMHQARNAHSDYESAVSRFRSYCN